MIAIVSSDARERAALVVMCETHGWPSAECESRRAFERLCTQLTPGIVITRHKLSDGYADDIMMLLARNGGSRPGRVIVLLHAGSAAVLEARQIALGASCVLRDPIRAEVLLAYLHRYGAETASLPAGPAASRETFAFAGATIHAIERRIEHAGRKAGVTPREMELLRLLHEGSGQVVSYDTLYSEILGRRFRGETSNMRVLLGILARSFDAVGISLRQHIEVIPKTGYRYRDGTAPLNDRDA